MSETRATDAIVVGGGLAGLTAAALLARAGRSVRLFERAGQVGGRARTQDKDGFLFNLGPHALYRGGQAIRVLRELGVPFEGRIPSVAGWAVRDGRGHAFPGTPLALLTTGLLRPAAKLEIVRLLLAIPRVKPETVAHQTVEEWLGRNVRHPEARQLLAALFRLSSYADGPERMSAGAALGQVQMVLKDNVLYLHGGWQTLVDGLRRPACAAGVEIVTGERVAAVEADRAARGVRLDDGTLHAARAVVLAVGPSDAVSMIGPERAPAVAEWADRTVPIRTASLAVALSYLPRPRVPFALAIDRPLYLSVHSAAAGLAPMGGALVHAAKYLRPDAAPDAEADERELEGLLDLAQPGWSGAVAHRRFLARLTVSNALPLAADGGLAGRPGPRVDEIANLYLAGDWVGQEGLLADAAVASAARAAELVLQAMRDPAADDRPEPGVPMATKRAA